MSIQDNLTKLRNEHLVHLQQLLEECESFLPNPVSALDPMSRLRERTQKMASSLRKVISQQSAPPPDDLLALFRELLSDIPLLNDYNEVLLDAVKLIFSMETSLFRMKERPVFVACVLNLYNDLVSWQKLLGDRLVQLSSLLHAFEHQFCLSYNKTNRDIMRFDQVHDLLSHTFDAVSPPLIDINKVIKRDFFRISSKKLSFDHLLVEMFQFSNGEMAIFKANSGELSNISSPPQKLLLQLVKGDYRLLDLGRTLLFPLLREYDLEIINVLSSSTVELKTCTGNNVSLKVQCVDPLQWETHWKLSFKKLFDKKNLIPMTYRSTSSASLAKSSHPYQTFKLKLTKLQDQRPDSTEGLPIWLPSPLSPDDSFAQEANISRSHHSGLHRSKPLQRPLSTLMLTKEERDFQPQLTESPSLKDLEDLSCEKLIELDRAIKMEFSPVSISEPVIQRYKSVSEEPLFEKMEMNSEREVEESDLESYLSTSEAELNHDAPLHTTSPLFNPSAEVYKPTLYSRKSSSLLSIFSSRSKKEKESSESLENNESTNSPFSRSSSAEVDSKDNLLENDLEELPAYLSHDNDETIFENKTARISFWNGKQWTRVGHTTLELSIYRLENGTPAIVGYTSKDRGLCKFAANISPKWKLNRSAAQDIQVSIPKGDYIVSVIPEGISTLTIRCCEAERLLNVLQHCVKGNLPNLIPKSSTVGTLSSAPSSCISNVLTRSSTGMSGLTNSKNNGETINTHLLVPSSRIRLHCMINNQGWHVKTVGFVDIYSQDYRGVTVGIKFDILTAEKSVISVIGRLDEIQRIGRTGLHINGNDEEKLLEFQNKLIADQVYKLIKPRQV